MMRERWCKEGMSETMARRSNSIISLFLPSLIKPFVSLKYFRCTVARFDSGNCSPVSLNSLVMLPPSHAVFGMMIWEGGEGGEVGGKEEREGR